MVQKQDREGTESACQGGGVGGAGGSSVEGQGLIMSLLMQTREKSIRCSSCKQNPKVLVRILLSGPETEPPWCHRMIDLQPWNEKKKEMTCPWQGWAFVVSFIFTVKNFD
ncbi:hypothetical protein GOODEAATRI_010363 [Goodea atripinnis]|uniref:Uncharacterized protein n=1 Tax=Goodea atripinnis TaxID=208336 RepID=A0ABV0PCX4_9TELE